MCGLVDGSAVVSRHTVHKCNCELQRFIIIFFIANYICGKDDKSLYKVAISMHSLGSRQLYTQIEQLRSLLLSAQQYSSILFTQPLMVCERENVSAACVVTKRECILNRRVNE